MLSELIYTITGGDDTAKVSYDFSYSNMPYNSPIACGFKPKIVFAWTGTGTRGIIYDESQSTTQIRQTNGSWQDIGTGNVWTLKSIDDVGSEGNPTGGFTLGKYSTSNWTDFFYIAIG